MSFYKPPSKKNYKNETLASLIVNEFHFPPTISIWQVICNYKIASKLRIAYILFFILERIRNISLIFAWKSLFPSSRYLFDFSADFRPIRDLTSKSATKGLETNQKTFKLLKRKLIHLELDLTINQKLVQYK